MNANMHEFFVDRFDGLDFGVYRDVRFDEMSIPPSTTPAPPPVTTGETTPGGNEEVATEPVGDNPMDPPGGVQDDPAIGADLVNGNDKQVDEGTAPNASPKDVVEGAGNDGSVSEPEQDTIVPTAADGTVDQDKVEANKTAAVADVDATNASWAEKVGYIEENNRRLNDKDPTVSQLGANNLAVTYNDGVHHRGALEVEKTAIEGQITVERQDNPNNTTWQDLSGQLSGENRPVSQKFDPVTGRPTADEGSVALFDGDDTTAINTLISNPQLLDKIVEYADSDAGKNDPNLPKNLDQLRAIRDLSKGYTPTEKEIVLIGEHGNVVSRIEATDELLTKIETDVKNGPVEHRDALDGLTIANRSNPVIENPAEQRASVEQAVKTGQLPPGTQVDSQGAPVITVQEGDSYWAIAERLRPGQPFDPKLWEALRATNSGQHGNYADPTSMLSPGDQLRLPPEFLQGVLTANAPAVSARPAASLVGLPTRQGPLDTNSQDGKIRDALQAFDEVGGDGNYEPPAVKKGWTPDDTDLRKRDEVLGIVREKLGPAPSESDIRSLVSQFTSEGNFGGSHEDEGPAKWNLYLSLCSAYGVTPNTADTYIPQNDG